MRGTGLEINVDRGQGLVIIEIVAEVRWLRHESEENRAGVPRDPGTDNADPGTQCN